MPIITERISEGIYCHQWQGHVNIDEIVEAFEIEKKLSTDDSIDKYVAILDGSEMKTMPLNLIKLAKLKTGDELALLIYKAPNFAQSVGKAVSKLAGFSMEFYDDWDHTLARANQLISEHKATIVVE